MGAAADGSMYYRKCFAGEDRVGPISHELDAVIDGSRRSHIDHTPSRCYGISLWKAHPRVLALRRILGVQRDLIIGKTQRRWEGFEEGFNVV